MNSDINKFGILSQNHQKETPILGKITSAMTEIKQVSIQNDQNQTEKSIMNEYY
jgi:hypothetical protein